MAELLLLADGLGIHHDDIEIGWWLVMVIAMVAFWGLALAVVVGIVRGAVSSRRVEEPDDPLELLDRRLAEGQISIDEYEKRRAILSERRAGSQGS